jgi:hypothetical protein
MFNAQNEAVGAAEVETVAAVETGAQAGATVEAPEYAIIDNLEVRIFKETVNFKAVKDAAKQEGFEYDAVLDKDNKPTGTSRRKSEVVRIAYPLLANFGMSAPYNEAKNDYADKSAALLYSLICNSIYNEVRGFLNEGKGFKLEEISFNAIANKERATRGGRTAEVDQVLLEKAVESLEAFLTAAGKKKDVISHHVQMFKTRLRNALVTKVEIVSRMQMNMCAWYESLDQAAQEEFGSVFMFWDGKFKAVLGTEITDDDY